MTNHYRLVIEFDTEIQAKGAYHFWRTGSIAQRRQHKERKSSVGNTDWRQGNIGISGVDMDNKNIIVSEFLGHGIVHLYKIGEATSEESDLLRIPGDDTMVSILFVPNYLTVHELLHSFLGDDVVDKVSHFRVIRCHEEMGFKFMVLMKFRESITARHFKEQYDGKKFNSMDPEECHVVYIKEIVFRKQLFPGLQKSNFPYLLHDPFTNSQPQNDVELPTCPVCLERMDSETTGLVTIPCQHTFHCQCLDKWKDSRCPVCRYSTLKITRSAVLSQNTRCSTCGASENLWICLICGNIGCGRYNSKHAIQHYEDTAHCFAMDIATQRVWDYAGDNYVHRLIQNEVDGKLVEVGSSSRENSSKNNKDYHLEYVHVLISQLESQREYYESKLEQSTRQQHDQVTLSMLQQQMEGLRVQVSDSATKHKQQIAFLNDQLKEERMLSKGLQQNLEHLSKSHQKLQEQYDKNQEEKQDLQEQVNDLMFYLESQEKFKNADESVKQGKVVIKQKKGAQSSKR